MNYETAQWNVMRKITEALRIGNFTARQPIRPDIGFRAEPPKGSIIVDYTTPMTPTSTENASQETDAKLNG